MSKTQVRALRCGGKLHRKVSREFAKPLVWRLHCVNRDWGASLTLTMNYFLHVVEILDFTWVIEYGWYDFNLGHFSLSQPRMESVFVAILQLMDSIVNYYTPGNGWLAVCVVSRTRLVCQLQGFTFLKLDLHTTCGMCGVCVCVCCIGYYTA